MSSVGRSGILSEKVARQATRLTGVGKKIRCSKAYIYTHTHLDKTRKALSSKPLCQKYDHNNSQSLNLHIYTLS